MIKGDTMAANSESLYKRTLVSINETYRSKTPSEAFTEVKNLYTQAVADVNNHSKTIQERFNAYMRMMAHFTYMQNLLFTVIQKMKEQTVNGANTVQAIEQARQAAASSTSANQAVEEAKAAALTNENVQTLKAVVAALENQKETLIKEIKAKEVLITTQQKLQDDLLNFFNQSMDTIESLSNFPVAITP